MSFPSRFSHYRNVASHFKKRRGLNRKLRVDWSQQEKCLLRSYFDFWITYAGIQCCVYLKLPEESILFSNLIFIILHSSVPGKQSKEWIHFAGIVHTTFLEKALISDFFQIQVAALFPIHVFPDTGFFFVEMILKKQPWKDGMWNCCGSRLMFVTCQCHSAQSYTFFSPIYSALRFPFTALNKKRGIVGMQEDCFHSAAIKPLQMEREWKAFCFVLLSFFQGFFSVI